MKYFFEIKEGQNFRGDIGGSQTLLENNQLAIKYVTIFVTISYLVAEV